MTIAGHRWDDTATVREQLWLLAHNEDKNLRPLIDPGALGVGLAGATLIDLVLARRIHLDGGQVQISDRWDHRTAGDSISSTLLNTIRRVAPAPLVALLRDLSPDLYERTQAGLVADGIITTRRRTLRADAHDLSFPATNVRIRAKLTYRVTGRYPHGHLTTDALCVLVPALRLHDVLNLVLPDRRQAGQLFHRVTHDLGPHSPIPMIAHGVGFAVGDLATAAF